MLDQMVLCCLQSTVHHRHYKTLPCNPVVQFRQFLVTKFLRFSLYLGSSRETLILLHTFYVRFDSDDLTLTNSTSSFCNCLQPSLYIIQNIHPNIYKTCTICKHASLERALQLNAPVGLYSHRDEKQKVLKQTSCYKIQAVIALYNIGTEAFGFLFV